MYLVFVWLGWQLAAVVMRFECTWLAHQTTTQKTKNDKNQLTDLERYIRVPFQIHQIEREMYDIAN